MVWYIDYWLWCLYVCRSFDLMNSCSSALPRVKGIWVRFVYWRPDPFIACFDILFI